MHRVDAGGRAIALFESGFHRFGDITINFEHAIELRDLDQSQYVFPKSHKLENPIVVSHLALSNQESTQSAAVAEIHLGKINNEILQLGTAEEKEFSFQFSRDGKVKPSLFELENRCAAVFPNLKIHKSSTPVKTFLNI